MNDLPRRSQQEAVLGAAIPQAMALGPDPVSHLPFRMSYERRETGQRWRLETLLVEGHTDNVPIAAGGRITDSLELSSMRAATIYRMIRQCEPRVERLQNEDHYQVLSTSGYGYTRPAPADESRLNENRRIDLRFLMEPPKGVPHDELRVRTDVREQVS